MCRLFLARSVTADLSCYLISRDESLLFVDQERHISHKKFSSPQFIHPRYCFHALPHVAKTELLIAFTKLLVVQACLTLYDTRDCSPTSSSVHGILHTRILQCVAIPFSRGSSQSRDQTGSSAVLGGFFNLQSHQGSPSDSLQNPKCSLSGPALNEKLASSYLYVRVHCREKKKIKGRWITSKVLIQNRIN